MHPIITSSKPVPSVDLTGHANLDIKLDSWPAAARVGIISATVFAISALFLKFRS